MDVRVRADLSELNSGGGGGCLVLCSVVQNSQVRRLRLKLPYWGLGCRVTVAESADL